MRRLGILLSITCAVVLTAVVGAQSAAPVADAAMNGDRAAVKTLLQQGGDVNAAQGDGMTALHWAAMKNDAELAQMLVYAGANVKATTRLGGNTPLIIAARNGNAGVVQARHRGTKRVQCIVLAVAWLGCEEADGIVTPIVGELLLDQQAIVDHRMDGQ